MTDRRRRPTAHHHQEREEPVDDARIEPVLETGSKPEDALRLIVRDLDLTCLIGVYDRERGKPQRLRVNMEVAVRPPAAYDDDFAEVVDYSAVLKRVRAAAAESEVFLLETLADRILCLCFAEPRVLAAKVRIEKLDRYADLAGLGIELERRRPG
jgi:dihydroneopterin aldolase